MDILYLVLTVIISIFQVIVLQQQIWDLYKFHKYKAIYPLKQLSPTITLLQGLFLIMCQISLLIDMYMFEENCQCQDHYTIKVINTFFYTFSRGCCFSFALLKTSRIVLAFRKNQLQDQYLLVQYFSSEKIIIISGIIYSLLGFTLLSFLTTYFYEEDNLQCWLDYYHNNREYIMINSLIEEFLFIILMGYIIYYHLEDRLYKLTFNILVIYMFWFIVTSIIGKCYLNKGIIKFILIISFWIRACVMFYFYVRYPIDLKEQHPTLYLNSNEILTFNQISALEFQGHYKDSLILKQFVKYLQDLDSNDKDKLKKFKSKINFTQFNQQKLYQIYLQINNFFNQPAPMDIVEEYLMKEFHNNQILNELENKPEIFQQELGEYLSDVYENGFKKTNSFQTIINYYNTQETAVENLKTLGMSLDQYKPIKKK